MALKIGSHANTLRLPVMKFDHCMYAQINITDFVCLLFLYKGTPKYLEIHTNVVKMKTNCICKVYITFKLLWQFLWDHYCNYTKGQLISEWLLDVLNFPKMQRNIARISALVSKMDQIKKVKAPICDYLWSGIKNAFILLIWSILG